MSSENEKILLDYKSERNVTKDSLNTPNANMADLSAGPGLVARKRG